MSPPEPYVLRKVGLALFMPLVVFAVWLAVIELVGFDFPLWVIVAAAAFVLFRVALDTERLRVDADGVRVRPAARIPWAQIDAVHYRAPTRSASGSSPAPRSRAGSAA